MGVTVAAQNERVRHLFKGLGSNTGRFSHVTVDDENTTPN